MIENLRIQAQQALINPETLISEYPLTPQAMHTVSQARTTIQNIINGVDDRLLIIVGPCSIHDPIAGLEYAKLLRTAASDFADQLFIVMRTYFEKPRTTVGWKGLISDPFLDNSFDTNSGLRLARKLLLDINELGLPTATEFLDTLIPQYLSDLISWCAIGARTSESQLHRELASGLAMPVGFKNSTDGNVQIAIDAVNVARKPHPFLSINQKGLPTVMQTSGNHSCHIVLRGGTSGSNFSKEHVQNALTILKSLNLNSRLMIDCSHGNSMKNHSLQRDVVNSIKEQVRESSHGIFGVMLESNLIAGKQVLQRKELLAYGQSITDGCVGWDETRALLNELAS